MPSNNTPPLELPIVIIIIITIINPKAQSHSPTTVCPYTAQSQDILKTQKQSLSPSKVMN